MKYDHKTISIDERLKKDVTKAYEKLSWSLMYDDITESQQVNLYFERPTNIKHKDKLLNFQSLIDKVFFEIECLLDKHYKTKQIQIKFDEINDLLADADQFIDKNETNRKTLAK